MKKKIKLLAAVLLCCVTLLILPPPNPGSSGITPLDLPYTIDDLV